MALERVTFVAGIEILACSERDRFDLLRHIGEWSLFQGGNRIGRGFTRSNFATELEAVEAAEKLGEEKLRSILLGPGTDH
ncbi:MAG TPA: hypothetical protein VMV45_08735 [Casimicrobiaceae bacterium]|nr:hypothetical protein [Casimicrobiaceae bacterium]